MNWHLTYTFICSAPLLCAAQPPIDINLANFGPDLETCKDYAASANERIAHLPNEGKIMEYRCEFIPDLWKKLQKR
jgi:hypothetical protein